jgi:hypothetical protein
MDWLGDYFGWIFNRVDGLVIGELVLAGLSVTVGLIIVAGVLTAAISFVAAVVDGYRHNLRS